MADLEKAVLVGAVFEESPHFFTPMAKVKLKLKQRSDANLRAFAKAHIISISERSEFPSPEPTPEVFDGAVAEFEAAAQAAVLAKAAWKAAVRLRDEKRAVLGRALRVRANYVDSVSGGEATLIVAVGMGVAIEGTRTLSLPQVVSLVAREGRNEGEVRLSWKGRDKGVLGFYIECREDVAGAAWVYLKGTTKLKATAEGLTPGMRYHFRVRAFGAGELLGPWSAEAQRRCP